MHLCTAACESMPICTNCGLTKQPNGRSAPLDSLYCNFECPGYYLDPKAGHLWPGERAFYVEIKMPKFLTTEEIQQRYLTDITAVFNKKNEECSLSFDQLQRCKIDIDRNAITVWFPENEHLTAEIVEMFGESPMVWSVPTVSVRMNNQNQPVLIIETVLVDEIEE